MKDVNRAFVHFPKGKNKQTNNLYIYIYILLISIKYIHP